MAIVEGVYPKKRSRPLEGMPRAMLEWAARFFAAWPSLVWRFDHELLMRDIEAAAEEDQCAD